MPSEGAFLSRRAPSLLDSWRVMWRVIVAVILRETKTRFGKNKLGYLWALIEPIAYVSIILFIRSHLATTLPFGESFFTFFITGMLTFRMFKALSGRTLSAISANMALLTYPLVKPVDTIFARIILESLTMLVVFFVFFTFLAIMSGHQVIHYPGRFVAAVTATILLGAGIGCFNAVVSILLPAWQRIWSILNFPLLIVSGIFYLPKGMPPLAQKVLYWNPILHCVEWMRYATYLDYDPLLDKVYVLSFAIIAMTVGLALERAYRFSLVRP